MPERNYIKGEVLAFDKPIEWSSFYLVKKVRSVLKKNLKVRKLKVGHAGTLDPLATGVMVLCTGKATKQLAAITAGEKEYMATIKLGATTPSFDRETAEDGTFETKHITAKLVEDTLKQFEGTIAQTPPAFSAVRINGQRAYALARKGEMPKLEPKKVHIKEIQLLSFTQTSIKMKIVCNKGVYIRSLANDLGKQLNSGAYLTDLVRTRVGEFTIDKCLTFDTFLENFDQLN